MDLPQEANHQPDRYLRAQWPRRLRSLSRSGAEKPTSPPPKPESGSPAVPECPPSDSRNLSPVRKKLE